jgi:hypothetical protein
LGDRETEHEAGFAAHPKDWGTLQLCDSKFPVDRVIILLHNRKQPELPRDSDRFLGPMARWDNEGGATESVDRQRSSKTMACKCSLLLTDDRNEGKNQAIVRCQLAEGHTGKHRRNFTKLGKHGKQGEVAIEWDRNINDSEDPDDHEIGGQG